MSVMVVGSDRACFQQADRTEFFDIFYCLSPEQLPAGGDPAAAAVSAAQAFIVEGLAPLFRYWRQPVSDHVAVSALAFALAVGSDHNPTAVKIVGDFIAAVGGCDYRSTLDQLTRLFWSARKSRGTADVEQLFGPLLLDLLVDPAHLQGYASRIESLLTAAVQGFSNAALPEPSRCDTVFRSRLLTSSSKSQHIGRGVD